MGANLRFRVTILGSGKMRYYNDLDEIISDLSVSEIKQSSIYVLYNSVVVGRIDRDNFAIEASWKEEDREIAKIILAVV